METYEVIIVNLDTKAENSLIVEVDEAETTEDIIIKTEILGEEITSSNECYLTAYQEFRDKLLRLGLGIKCNGSRINAVQSGMMAAVAKVYLVELGKQALMKDIVGLWEYADLSDFPDSKQQQDFFEQWINKF